jgi:hypothetical protein
MEGGVSITSFVISTSSYVKLVEMMVSKEREDSFFGDELLKDIPESNGCHDVNSMGYHDVKNTAAIAFGNLLQALAVAIHDSFAVALQCAIHDTPELPSKMPSPPPANVPSTMPSQLPSKMPYPPPANVPSTIPLQYPPDVPFTIG